MQEIDFNIYTEEQLGEIWCNLNCFEWDYRLGEEPVGWNDMMEHSLKPTNGATRYMIVTPIMSAIESKIGQYGTSRSWHLYKLKRTEQEFKQYWESR